jgi:CheY-like chemotaxis protein
MTSQHSDRHAIYVAGFPEHEAAAFTQFFHIAGQRPPGWWITGKIEEAAVVLLRASFSQDIDAFYAKISPWQKVVIIGLSDFGTGWPYLPRPIKLIAILNKINEMARQRELNRVADTIPVSLEQIAQLNQLTQPMPLRELAPEPTPGPAPLMAPFADKFQDAPVAAPAITPPDTPPAYTPPVHARPGTISIDTASSFVAPTAPAPASFAARAAARTAARTAALVPRQVVPAVAGKPATTIQKPAFVPAAPASQTLGRVLVVDDSDVALKFMQNRLRQFGYEGQLARSGEEALALVAGGDFKFVFMDVMMSGLDGYQTCKAIKQNKARKSAAPVVVMLTSRGGTIDKIRGSMAGCDAYLTKPLNEKHLITILVKHDPAMAAELQSSDAASRSFTSDRPASRSL